MDSRLTASYAAESIDCPEGPSRNREGEAPAEPCAAERPGSAGASPSQMPPFETASDRSDRTSCAVSSETSWNPCASAHSIWASVTGEQLPERTSRGLTASVRGHGCVSARIPSDLQ